MRHRIQWERPLQALLDIIACPSTGAPLRLEGDPHDGMLVSEAGAQYPIIGGIPRLLPPDLLAPFLRGAYPEVLEARPGLASTLSHVPDPDAEVLDTLVSYSHQHVDLADEGRLEADWRATWDRFQPGLAPEAFTGETVLEVGSGEGRHACLVGAHARLLVGLDLSRGVELARRRDSRSHVFYVQGDLRRPPFRPGVFDGLYSNGVLHHTPDPAASFRAVAPLVRAGGRVSVWVYGLDEMRWTYRMSHLTWLRPLTNRLPQQGQVAVAAGLTAAVEAGLWTPVRLLRRVGLDHVAARLPYHDAADKDWRYKLRRMFDRLNPPVTHYITREALLDWFADFDGVEVINADGQGWTGRGRAT